MSNNMNVISCRCLVAVFLYFGVVILVIVNGQSTTDGDFHNYEISNLIDIVAQLRYRIAKLEAQSKPDASTNNDEHRGTSYIRWGRKTCENNATLVYEGYAAGAYYNAAGGSGSNFLCLHKDPQWKNYIDGNQIVTGHIYGVEYQLFNSESTYHNNIFSEINSDGSPLLNRPAPCAVCYVSSRSTILMIPARTQCPDGWTIEYEGYLASGRHENKGRSKFICLNEAPEVGVGGTDRDQALFYPVEVFCGSLPCSQYISGRELTCVVCSK